MASWLERLLPASFRGVPFKYLSNDLEGGRRIVTHEYPLRDTPYAEDLGRSARRYDVQAILLGETYDLLLLALRAALEKEGPGLLTHPAYGLIRVVVLNYRIEQSTAEGGMARISITFGEAGSNAAPFAILDRLGEIAGQAADVWAKVQLGLDIAYKVADLPSLVQDAAGVLVTGALGAVAGVGARLGLTVLDHAALDTGVTDALATLPTITASAALVGAQTIGRVATLQPLVGGAAKALGSAAPAGALAGARWEGYRAMSDLAGWGATLTPDLVPGSRQDLNQTAVATAVHSAAIAAACVCACQAVADAADTASIAALPRGVPVSAQQIYSLRTELLALVDTCQASAPDAEYQAWSGLRASVATDLAERALRAPRVQSYRPAQTRPALALAHRLYQDAGRADELVRRNGVRHPGFVPGGLDLEVLNA